MTHRTQDESAPSDDSSHARAIALVSSAIQDLEEASAMMHKKGGVIAGAAAVPGAIKGSAGWKEVGLTMGHDGRCGTLKLVQVSWPLTEP